MQDFNNTELEDFIDSIAEYIKEMPKPEVSIYNFKKMPDILTAKDKLYKLLCDSGSDCQISFEISELWNSGFFEVEMDDIEIHEPQLFTQIISLADNFEIYPLLSGKLRMSITFRKLFIRLPKNKIM